MRKFLAASRPLWASQRRSVFQFVYSNSEAFRFKGQPRLESFARRTARVTPAQESFAPRTARVQGELCSSHRTGNLGSIAGSCGEGVQSL